MQVGGCLPFAATSRQSRRPWPLPPCQHAAAGRMATALGCRGRSRASSRGGRRAGEIAVSIAISLATRPPTSEPVPPSLSAHSAMFELRLVVSGSGTFAAWKRAGMATSYAEAGERTPSGLGRAEVPSTATRSMGLGRHQQQRGPNLNSWCTQGAIVRKTPSCPDPRVPGPRFRNPHRGWGVTCCASRDATIHHRRLAEVIRACRSAAESFVVDETTSALAKVREDQSHRATTSSPSNLIS